MTESGSRADVPQTARSGCCVGTDRPASLLFSLFTLSLRCTCGRGFSCEPTMSATLGEQLEAMRAKLVSALAGAVAVCACVPSEERGTRLALSCWFIASARCRLALTLSFSSYGLQPKVRAPGGAASGPEFDQRARALHALDGCARVRLARLPLSPTQM